MKRHTLAQLLKTASEIYKIPTLSSCTIDLDGNKLAIEAQLSQLDLDRNEQTKFLKRYLFETDDKNTLTLLDTSKPIPIQNNSWRSKSKNNKFQAVISNWKDKTEDKQFLEIWNGDSKITNINLTKLDKHDKLYDSSLVWSSDATKIAYIAEIKKTKKVSSFFTSTDENIDENNYQEKYSNHYVDEWGEQNIGKSQSVIAIFDLNTHEVKIVENLPADVCPSSLTWYKNDGIVFSGLYTKPYRLGLIYCPIRKSELFYYDLNDDKCVQLTVYNESVREPRFSNDYKILCWLQNPANGPHFRCSTLMSMDWDSKKVDVLVDIVKEAGDFSGIFSLCLLNECWSMDNKRIILSTGTGHRSRIISCDVESRIVTVLDNSLNDLNNCECMSFENDWICALTEGYNKRQTLIVGKLPERGHEKMIKWNVTGQLDGLEAVGDVELLKFDPECVNVKFPNVKFEAMLVKKDERNGFLVVFPHGGPHSAFSCEFSPHVAILVSLGYAVLLVNYRGSTGYGQDGVDSLPGLIGTQDVSDMQQAAEFCMKKYDFKKAVVYGGSHGGFLSTHLIGQFPDFYAAAAVRNPVTQLEAMRSLSDIPDWVITETFGKYDFDYKNDGTKENYEELMKKSPIRYIDDVKTPVLLLVGNIDLRVPASQSKEYYKGLIARGKTARLVVYKDDNHPLSKPQTTADCIINAVLWYEKYLID
jgi:acylaminoacyl-peptidase